MTTNQNQFFKLTEAALKLTPTYFRLNEVNLAIKKLTCIIFLSDEVDEAERIYKTAHEQLLEAAYLINDAIESNKHILKKINKGFLLENWREFVNDRKEIKNKLKKKKGNSKRRGSLKRGRSRNQLMILLNTKLKI